MDLTLKSQFCRNKFFFDYVSISLNRDFHLFLYSM